MLSFFEILEQFYSSLSSSPKLEKLYFRIQIRVRQKYRFFRVRALHRINISVFFFFQDT